jgi:hypothetical protein
MRRAGYVESAMILSCKVLLFILFIIALGVLAFFILDFLRLKREQNGLDSRRSRTIKKT